MNYLQFDFILESKEDYQKDLLIYSLGEAGFDTFEETPAGFSAFVVEENFDEQAFDSTLSSFEDQFEFSFTKRIVPQENWNKVWESNFEPLIIKEQCYVRATFHQPRPEFSLEIVIDPKMSFGTGHHQTTTMMMEYILEEDFSGKCVLDMGAGTGILAILAAKLGATDVTAIDYDPVCYDSMIENSRLNHTHLSEILCGSKEVIPNKRFNIILANINRNILLDQFDRYVDGLVPNGELYLSGFFTNDVPILVEKAGSLNLSYQKHKELDNWAAVKFLKQT